MYEEEYKKNDFKSLEKLIVQIESQQLHLQILLEIKDALKKTIKKEEKTLEFLKEESKCSIMGKDFQVVVNISHPPKLDLHKIFHNTLEEKIQVEFVAKKEF